MAALWKEMTPMSLTILECEAAGALEGYLASGYTIDLGGLIGIVASQFTPSEPRDLAVLAVSAPFLLTREPDLTCAAIEGLTPYALLQANTYEHLAACLRQICDHLRTEDPAAA